MEYQFSLIRLNFSSNIGFIVAVCMQKNDSIESRARALFMVQVFCKVLRTMTIWVSIHTNSQSAYAFIAARALGIIVFVIPLFQPHGVSSGTYQRVGIFCINKKEHTYR